jgi:predicted SnoaL-like aldol condensation-catalyzing enzyme
MRGTLGGRSELVLPRSGMQWNHCVPTLLRQGPYRFFIYSGDRDEPPHVHVERENRVAKVWLDPVRLVPVHSRVDMAPGEIYSVMHIFRFRDGRIAELWDLAEKVPVDSPNKDGAF